MSRTHEDTTDQRADRLYKNISDHFESAIYEADDKAEMRYHIREALQLLIAYRELADADALDLDGGSA